MNRAASPRIAALVGAVALVVAACSSGGDLSDAVEGTATQYLDPVYRMATEALSALPEAVSDACEMRDQGSLEQARRQWAQTQDAWKTTQAGWFGPTTMDRYDSSIGYEPTNAEGIEQTLASDAVIDASYVREALPTTQQGLGAVEYILFSGAMLDDRRCEYATAVADTVREDATALGVAWFDSWEGGTAYLDRFRGVAEPAMDSDDAIGDQVGGIVEVLKLLTLQQLGRELGITAPAPVPGAFPEGAAEYGLGSLQAQLEGIASAYGSDPDGSISASVRARSEDVDSAIVADLAAARALVDNLIGEQGAHSMATAVAQDRGTLEDLYGLLATLRRTFETDVVSLLDIALGFSDTDGDTG